MISLHALENHQVLQGANYAIELGMKVAKLVHQSKDEI